MSKKQKKQKKQKQRLHQWRNQWGDVGAERLFHARDGREVLNRALGSGNTVHRLNLDDVTMLVNFLLGSVLMATNALSLSVRRDEPVPPSAFEAVVEFIGSDNLTRMCDVHSELSQGTPTTETQH